MARTIAESIRQERPFRSLEVQGLVSLVRTTDRVLDGHHRLFARNGLSLEQFNVLRILRGAGPKGIRTYEVADRMLSRSPNITRLVDKMEAKGLLTRRQGGDDHRVVELRLASEGRKVLRRLEGEVNEADCEAMSGLGKRDIRQLIHLLDRLREPHEVSRGDAREARVQGEDNRSRLRAGRMGGRSCAGC